MQQNWILHAHSRHHYWSGAGALSIKSFTQGQAYYEVGAARFLVDEHAYLVLNQGQEYTITVDTPTAMESFCIFFAPDFAQSVCHSLGAPTEGLLDDPQRVSAPVTFFERTYPHDDLLSPTLANLRKEYPLRRDDAVWVEEQLHCLMRQLLITQDRVRSETARLGAVRPATRTELYQRLWLAYDYIAAEYAQPLSLAEIARMASLSPNHLLRSFKQLFGQTPHQFLTERRLERAKWLLRHTDHPVTEICFAVGFASLGSFSWLFRRRVGFSPEQFRRLQSG
ncbi:MAG: AraC family transcriptional regulator [Chloroflexi bacterium]|nr:MAG: AraC family transcriptional regulator [Chloroflexota bacterium]